MTFLTAALVLSLVGWGQPGTSVFPLARIGQGPRAAAMGEAYVGLAGDASANYWNPAGLGQFPDYHFALSHHQWFSDVMDEVFHAALPAGPGALGLGVVYSGDPGIEYWNEQNQPGPVFRTWNMLVSAGYGAPVASGYYVGGAVQGMYEDLYSSSGYGGAANVGVLAQPLTFLGLGLSARNLGVMRYGGGWEMLPMELTLGGNGHIGPVTATLDAVLPYDNTFNVRAGVEYSPVPRLALRLGYRTGPADVSTLGILSGLTGGLGVTLGSFGFDYAVSPYGKLGIAHRLGIRTSFVRRGSGAVVVKVIDANTMTPLWASVSFSGIREIATETDKHGKLELDVLPRGQLIIHTIRSEYVPRSDTLLVLGDREQHATIALRPLEYGGIWGRVFDATTDKPIGGIITYRGPAFGEQTVDPAMGSYALRGIPSGEYMVSASGPTEDYFPQTCTLEVEPGKVMEKNFRLLKRRQTIVLEGINFETGEAEILPRFHGTLDRAGTILKDNPEILVELAGHTDSREINTEVYPSNWELSQARAEAVRDYLVEKFKIAAGRLTARGYADTQPVASNSTEAGMARNRRTEFRILEQ